MNFRKGKTFFSAISIFYPFIVLALLRFWGASFLEVPLKLYPVLVNGVFLFLFSWSLVRPPPWIFKFATLQDKSILSSVNRPVIEVYCRKVTWVWCAFFVFNASVALTTVFLASDWVWMLYNGCISYLLMGLLFGVEWIVRKKIQRGLT